MTKSVIKFLQIRDGLPPTRAYEFDAGIDFYVPKFNEEFLKALAKANPHIFHIGLKDSIGSDEKGLFIKVTAHGRVLIPSGFKCRMEEPGRALIAANKSGVATKYGLIVGACIIDYFYQGEMHLSIINTSTYIVKIYQNQKIIQFLETPIIYSDIKISSQTDLEEFYEGHESDRGSSGFGSTDGKIPIVPSENSKK